LRAEGKCAQDGVTLQHYGARVIKKYTGVQVSKVRGKGIWEKKQYIVQPKRACKVRV